MFKKANLNIIKYKKHNPAIGITKDHLLLISSLCYTAEKQLENLHWDCVNFGANRTVLKNIDDKTKRIKELKIHMRKLFESQFTEIKQ